MGAACGVTWAQADRFELVRDGVPVAAIVIPDEPLEVERYAAEELQYHVRRASGAFVPIVSETDPAAAVFERHLFLGRTKPAESRGWVAPPLREGAVSSDILNRVKDGSFFRTLGAVTPLAEHELTVSELRANTAIIAVSVEALVIVGRDGPGDPLSNLTAAGTLFGVYRLLEEHLGVRWLWPGELGEHIPERKTIAFTGGGAMVYEPELMFSQFRQGNTQARVERWQNPEAAEQYYEAQARFLRRHRIGIGSRNARRETDLRVFHTFMGYWNRYHETHPEFFNLLPDGTRREHPGRGRGGRAVSLCVSEPGLWDAIVSWWASNWKGRMGQHVPLGENDTPGLCTCERCRSWDAPDPRFETSAYWARGQMYGWREGEHGSPFRIPDVVGNTSRWSWDADAGPCQAPSLSDRYARFYREVQKKAEAIDPHAMVAGFAYLNYWQAPKQFHDLNERVIISYVPPMPIPYTAEDSRAFRENFDGWRGAGARPYLRPNVMYGMHNMPLFPGRRMTADFRYAFKRGAIGTDLDTLHGQFGVHGPTLYGLVRSHTAALGADEILEEYYSAFGPAAEAVKAYFTHWESITDRDVNPDELESVYDGAMDGLLRRVYVTFPEPVMERGRELLRHARRVAGSDEPAARRVSYLRAAFEDAARTARAMRALVEYRRAGSTDSELEKQALDAREEMLRYRASIEAQVISDFARLYSWEERRMEVEPYDPRPDLPRRAVNAAVGRPDMRVAETVLDMPLPRENWRFRTAPDKEGYAQGWYNVDFDDSDWDTIEIGHSWTRVGYSGYTGSAWYRRTVEFPPEPATGDAEARAVELAFEGVDEMTWLWVNGYFVGSHHELGPSGWNVPFSLPIHDVIRWGEPNQIAVLAKNTVGGGGIYRPVSLNVLRLEPVRP